MSKIIFAALLFSLLGGCKKSNDADCSPAEPDCTGFACLVHWYYFDFKLVDKTNGQDLLFGPSPRYSLSEVKLFSDEARTIAVSYTANTTDQRLKVQMATPQLFLQVGSAVYRLDLEFRLDQCCESRVKNIRIDNQSICTCCAAVINVPVN